MRSVTGNGAHGDSVYHCTVISLQKLHLKLVAGREIFTSIVVCMGSVSAAVPSNEIHRHEPDDGGRRSRS